MTFKMQDMRGKFMVFGEILSKNFFTIQISMKFYEDLRGLKILVVTRNFTRLGTKKCEKIDFYEDFTRITRTRYEDFTRAWVDEVYEALRGIYEDWEILMFFVNFHYFASNEKSKLGKYMRFKCTSFLFC